MSTGEAKGIWDWGDLSTGEKIGYSLGAFAVLSDAYSIALGGNEEVILNSRNHSKIMDKSGRELYNPGMSIEDAIAARSLPWYKGLFAKRDLVTDYKSPYLPSKFDKFVERGQLINGVNLNRLLKYRAKTENAGNFLLGNPTSLGATNCAGWTSSALLNSGVFNIPIAIPGFFSLQMYVRQYSYYSYYFAID